MSYDIYLREIPEPAPCPTCGHLKHAETPELPNPTYNLTPIFDRAFTGESLPNPATSEAAVVLFGVGTDRPRGLRLLSGRKAKDTTAWLAKALRNLTDPSQVKVFRALEPSNGWGTLPDAIRTIECLLKAAQEFPELTWGVH